MWNQGGGARRDSRRGGYMGMYGDERDNDSDDAYNDAMAQQQRQQSGASSAQNGQPQQDSHAGRYTVIPPDEKKRQKLRAQAESGMRMYEQHKKQNTPQHVAYVGTVGGGRSSLAEARHQQAVTHAQHTKTSKLLKDQERKAKHREEEDKVLEERKAAARRQAEKNEQKQMERKEMWRDDMKRANRAFLDRLEAQQPRVTSAPSPNPLPPSAKQQAASSAIPAGRPRNSTARGAATATAATTTTAAATRSEGLSSNSAGHQRTGGTASASSARSGSKNPQAAANYVNDGRVSGVSYFGGRSSDGLGSEVSLPGSFSSRGSPFAGATFEGSLLGAGSNPRGSYLAGATFEGSLLGAGSNPRGSYLARGTFEGSPFGAGSNSRGSYIAWGTFEGSPLGAGANPRGSYLAEGTFEGSPLGAGANPRGSYLAEGTFEGSPLGAVSNSRGSYLAAGAPQSSVGGGTRSESSRSGGRGTSVGSWMDRYGSESSFAESRTSGGLFGSGYGFHDQSYPGERRSDDACTGGRAELQTSHSRGGRAFNGLSSGGLASGTAHAGAGADRSGFEPTAMEVDPYGEEKEEEEGFGRDEEEDGDFSGEEEEEEEGFDDDDDEKEEDDDGYRGGEAREAVPPGGGTGGADVEVWRSLETMHRQFPHYDESLLWDVLQQCGGSLERAVELLCL